jgi:hypothetical protein
MKKLLGLLCAGLFVAAMSGCGLNPAGSVTITIDPIADVTAGGGSVNVTGSIESDTVLTSVTISIMSGTNDVSGDFDIQFSALSNFPGEKKVELGPNELNLRIRAISASAGTYSLKIAAAAGSVNSSSEKTFNVTGGTAITTHLDTLGANQNTTYGSSIDLDGPTVYMTTASNSHVSEIDLCYAHAASPAGDYLFSPDQAKISGYTFASGWATAGNSTRFYKTSLTPTQFNAITTASQITAQWTDPGVATPYVACSANDVFIAKTDQNAIVLILITDQTAGATGSISLKIAK